MGKRYLDTLWRSLAFSAICVFLFGFLFPRGFTIRVAQIMIAGAALVDTFAFFILELRLFSRNLWIRRGIVFVIGFVVCALLFRIFGGGHYIKPWKYYLFAYGIAFIAGGAIFAFVCCVQDKIYQRSIKKINLALQKNEERGEE